MRNRHGRKFKCAGRWTAARQAILDVFLNRGGHLTADDVFMEVKKRAPGVGLATVYRNLDFLSREGLVSRFQFSDGRAHYELNDDEREHHHHLICKSCGNVSDYSEFIHRELKLMKDLEKELSKKHDFNIDSHELHFYGVCGDCRE